jgi:hexosaminidase
MAFRSFILAFPLVLHAFTTGRSRGPGPVTAPSTPLRSSDPPLPAYLYPYPENATLGLPLGVSASTFSLTSVGASSAVLTSALARYSAMLFPYGPPSVPGGVVTHATVNVTGTDVALRLGVDESYALATDAPGGGVSITAATCFGALRALETLSQLIQYNLSSGTYFMPAAAIADAPRFPFRGLMVDTARHFLSLPALRAVVDLMAYDKLNVLHIHISDDQSWPLVIEALPLLAGRGAYSNHSHTYTVADMKGLVAYAWERGVRVIPEFDTPAHFGILRVSYPNFMAQHVAGSYCQVDPSNPGLVPFLTTIWTALADIFPDDTFHIGGDEFWPTCWTENAKIMAWAQALGLKDVEAMYNYYIKQVSGILEKLGKKTMGWCVWRPVPFCCARARARRKTFAHAPFTLFAQARNPRL